MTKRGSSFGLRAVMYLGGELALDFLIGGVFISFECSEDLCTFLFFLFRYIILFVHKSCDHSVIVNIVLIYLT